MKAKMTLMLAALLLLGAASQDETKKTDKDKLKGSWTVVSAQRDGKNDDDIKKDVLTIDGDKISIKSATREEKGTLKLDESKNPRTIDLTADDPDKTTLLGIYSVDGDKLKLCFAK